MRRTFMEFPLNYSIASAGILFSHGGNLILLKDSDFDGLEGVTLITWFENQPEGWQDGWNGNCKVLWGRG